MRHHANINYNRIAEAIIYMHTHFKRKPDLTEVAEKINLSPIQFQQLFADWAGVGPKKFLQYTSVEYARQILKNNQETLFDAVYKMALSDTGRLHDLFIKIEAMTPGEFSNGGINLNINYSFAQSPFGQITIASTTKGVCHLAFYDDEEKALTVLMQNFPQAKYTHKSDKFQQNAAGFFTQEWNNSQKIKLHLMGTDFQLKVWQALLKIPQGDLLSYGTLANEINNPKASRAVGAAIGSNPVACLIPCHRVIQANGTTGGYMWGSARKSMIIGWEAAKLNEHFEMESQSKNQLFR